MIAYVKHIVILVIGNDNAFAFGYFFDDLFKVICLYRGDMGKMVRPVK